MKFEKLAQLAKVAKLAKLTKLPKLAQTAKEIENIIKKLQEQDVEIAEIAAKLDAADEALLPPQVDANTSWSLGKIHLRRAMTRVPPRRRGALAPSRATRLGNSPPL